MEGLTERVTVRVAQNRNSDRVSNNSVAISNLNRTVKPEGV